MKIKERVYNIITFHLRIKNSEIQGEMELRKIADKEHLERFFSALEEHFLANLDEKLREQMLRVEDVVQWATIFESEDYIKVKAVLGWREKILPIQNQILGIAPLVGAALFFIGVQIDIRDPQSPGEIISTVGMILAVQMIWGVDLFYTYLEKKKSSLLEKPGYPTLFWLLAILALLLDLAIGIVGSWINPFSPK